MISILKNIWNGIKSVLGWLDTIFGYFGDFLSFVAHIPVTIARYISYLPAPLLAVTGICITVAIIGLILGRRRL